MIPPGFEKRTSLSDAKESVRNAALRDRGEWWERFAPLLGPLAVLVLLGFTLGLVFWVRRDRPSAPLPGRVAADPAFPEPALIAPAPVAAPPAGGPRGVPPPPPEDPVLLALRQQVLAARRDAEAAEAARDWTAATRAYGAWREAQQAIHEREPASRYADWTALERITSALATIAAQPLAERVAGHRTQAEAAEGRGDFPAAVPLWAAARDAQAELNAAHPRSRLAAKDLPGELEVRRQGAASAAVVAEAGREAGAAAAALRERRFPAAVAAVRAALARLDAARTEFPLSRRLDPELRRRLVFLDRAATDLSALQDGLLERLVPLPGAPDRRLLASEVPQRLYERVMNHNPSQRQGPFFPVESVSWTEAEEFCLRASLLLGRPVRLPDEAEHRAALREERGAPRLAGKGIALTRAVPEVQGGPPAFSDLVGNVAEWLAAGDEPQARAAGGSYLTPADAAEMPLIQVPKTTRSPEIGFRYVVE
ncbi:MAG: formylglycine-generating enzyme family protein [Opitutaceae bacterium]